MKAQLPVQLAIDASCSRRRSRVASAPRRPRPIPACAPSMLMRGGGGARDTADASAPAGVGQQQLDVAVLRAPLRAVLDADLRVVVGELAPERGERVGAQAR